MSRRLRARLGFWLMRCGAAMSGLTHFGHHSIGDDVVILAWSNAPMKNISASVALGDPSPDGE